MADKSIIIRAGQMMESLRERIAAWWAQQLNTKEMSKIAQLPEWRIERELHLVLETQHRAKAVRNGMGLT